MTVGHWNKSPVARRAAASDEHAPAHPLPLCRSRLLPISAVVAVGLLAGCTGYLDSPGSKGSSGPPAAGPGSGAATGVGASAGSAGAAASVGTPAGEADPPLEASKPDLNTPPDANLPCVAGADASSPARMWRLTRLQLQNQLREFYRGLAAKASDNPLEGMVLPFGAVAAGDRFSTRTISYGLDEPSFRDLMAASAEVGRRLTTEASAEVCVGASDFAACLAALVAKAGQLAYHRPLTDEEVRQYAGIATSQKAAGVSDAEGVAQSLQAILMGPEANFRVEAGAPSTTGPMDAYAIGVALAYGLTDAPPDAELLQSAQSGALLNPSEIATQARRLIGDKGGAKKNPDQTAPIFFPSPMERFFLEYFRYGQVERVDKNRDLFGFHTPWALLEDTKRLVSELLIDTADGGLFQALFTGSTIYVESNTKNNYGLVGDFFNRTKVEAQDRAGMMTQPSFLAGFSQPEHNDPIRRGRFVRESMLCEALPGLPIGNIPKLDVVQFPVLRDALGQHRADPGCAGCHSLMDPIGFAFEEYDHLGRSRTEEAGRPVDASWQINGATEPGLEGVHQGARELGKRLSESPLVSRCFVAHSFQYWMGRPPAAGDGCSLEGANQAFQDSGGSYPALVASLLSSPSFLLRKTP